jgi:hypothetical protein
MFPVLLVSKRRWVGLPTVSIAPSDYVNSSFADASKVYSARTPREWRDDMAMSATSFPDLGLTYAIVYGCTSTLEDSILERLHPLGEAAAHPLVVPGVLVEIELLRHTRLVEANIVQVETKIFELDVVPGATEGGGEKENRRRNEAKRSAWLNLSYLRNSLITWHVELGKIMTHSNALKSLDGKDSVNIDDTIPWALREVGEKTRLRLETIRREYDEKIRHCTMRLDGMAMATQWVRLMTNRYNLPSLCTKPRSQSHSETAAEQAMAANRETKVMKSISLVTMVFLPGTFFAVSELQITTSPS